MPASRKTCGRIFALYGVFVVDNGHQIEGTVILLVDKAQKRPIEGGLAFGGNVEINEAAAGEEFLCVLDALRIRIYRKKILWMR